MANAISGKKIRIGNWTFPLRHFELSINVLRSNPAFNEWQTFEGFFNALLGAAFLFAYADPNDNAVTNQGFGEGDGLTTSFQLVRTLGGFVEPVFLIDQFPTINIGGVQTLNYLLSPTGTITFNTPPAAAALLTWSGTYKWPCRFDDDQMNFENFMFQLLRARSVKFSSEKLESSTGGVAPSPSGQQDAQPLGMP
jgi:uncharacterized protein (TIGR02217 family)